jgi:hypothetical protein
MTDAEDAPDLAGLRAARVAAEDDFLAQVREFESRVARVLEAASLAERAAAAAGVAAATATTGQGGTLTSQAPAAPRRLPDQIPWPGSSGGVRGALNALSRWLLRDYLAVLDRRHEALAERSLVLETDLDRSVTDLAERCDALQAGTLEMQHSIAGLGGEMRGVQAERVEALREGFNRVAETLDLIAGTALRLRTLMNAKDAEAVQRAVAAIDRKSETVLDLLARRQEALLAELVGRRLELEQLVAAARSGN